MNLNKVFVLGNLTRDPERRNLPNGNPVVNFGVATNRYYTTPDGEKHEEAEFHNIVIFGKLAETAAQYLRKGSLVLIEGRLRTRNWEDTAGVKHYKTEVITERMQLGPKSASVGMSTSRFQTSPATSSAPPSQPQIKNAVREEEIPVIEEDAPSQQEKPNLTNTPENNPLPNDNEEIDVRKIPF